MVKVDTHLLVLYHEQFYNMGRMTGWYLDTYTTMKEF